MTISDLLAPAMERNPPSDAVVFSVSERLGIVPQEELFTKKIALDDRSKYLRVAWGDVVYNPYLLWNRAVGVCFDRRGGCVSPAYVVLRPRAHGTEKFLHYFLRSKTFTTSVDAIASGSVTRRRTAPVNDILQLEFDLPPVDYQMVANVLLTDFDDKIELNRRMNETLDSMARAIFKSWFVDATENGIPKGWRIGKVGDVASINAQSIRGHYSHAMIEYVDISSVTTGRLEGTTRYELKNAPSRAQRLVAHGDTIWSCVRPNRRSFLFIHNPPSNLVVSTGFAVLTPKAVPPSYLYAWVTTDNFVDYLAFNADGSAYPAVRPNRFAQADILIPPSDLLNRFEAVVGPMRDKITKNELQSRTLAAIRDALLPKLLSGEVRVKDAEKVTP